MKKQWVFAAVLLACSASAMAVDGYKNLKFGMSLNEVNGSGLCTFGTLNKLPNNPAKFSLCPDLKFNGSIHTGVAYFINGKFLKFGIMQDNNDFIALAKGLKEKYGSPTAEKKGDDSLTLEFDKGVVALDMSKDSSGSTSTTLVYTSPEYMIQLMKNKTDVSGADL